MNRHTIFNLGAVTVMGLALLPDSAISQQKSLKEQLAGAEPAPQGEPTQPPQNAA